MVKCYTVISCATFHAQFSFFAYEFLLDFTVSAMNFNMIEGLIFVIRDQTCYGLPIRT
jgi:hypothetical protein